LQSLDDYILLTEGELKRKLTEEELKLCKSFFSYGRCYAVSNTVKHKKDEYIK
jgi:hypothetical protein